MTHTYLSLLWLAAPHHTERTRSHPHKNFRLYNFLCLKLRGHWTKSHQISTRSTEMIADYSAEIKIATFQSVWKRQRDEWRSSSNWGRIAATIARFNSIISEITGCKFTKFVHDVSGLLTFNLLKVDLRSANLLSNAEAKSKGRSTRHCEHLPNLTSCHSNVPWDKYLDNYPH